MGYDHIVGFDTNTMLPPGIVLTALTNHARSTQDQSVSHGSNAATSRPNTSGRVSWYGSVYPTNVVAGDLVYIVTEVAVEPPLVWHSSYSASGLALSDLAAVPSWPDLSGNGHTLTQATSGKQPVMYVAAGGNPAFVRFNGSKFMATAAFSPVLSQPGVVCMAVRMTTVNTSGTPIKRIFDGLDATNEWIIQQRGIGSSVAGYQAAAATVASKSGAVAGAWAILTFIVNGGSSSFRLNGSPTGSYNAGALSLGGIFLGGKFDETSAGDFDLGDLRLHVGLLTGGELAATEQFLADRYGVTLA